MWLAIILFLAMAIPVDHILAETLFTPTVIPISDREIINPMRGYYKWNDQEIISSEVMPHKDAFERYTWRQFETTAGIFSFSALDEDIAQAASAGQKYRFGIRALRGVADKYYAGIHVPDDLEPYGWWLDNGGTRYFIPDWNHDYFLERAESLLSAMGKKFNGDPRIAAVNIRLYGLYGEWHMSGVDYSLAPVKSAEYCSRSVCVNGKPVKPDNTRGAASLRRIIDMHIRSFPDKQLIMMVGQNDVSDAVMYALSRTEATVPPVRYPIGVRNECLGVIRYSDGQYHEHFRDMSGFTFWNSNTYTGNTPESIMRNRWMYAPFDTEYCYISSTMMSSTATNVFELARRQVIDFHVSTVGNGNIDAVPSGLLSQAIAVGKQAGYRYAVIRSVWPDRLTGGAFTVRTEWLNNGVAPAYEPWIVHLQLRQTDGSIAWDGKSTIRLRDILPTQSSPYIQTDLFTLPATVASGIYTAHIMICDPTHSCEDGTRHISGSMRMPLELANTGKTSDGSYPLGRISVGTAPLSPTPTANDKPGDANGDDRVDGLDYVIWLNHYGTIAAGAASGNFNGDTRVDGLDYVIWLSHYGT